MKVIQTRHTDPDDDFIEYAIGEASIVSSSSTQITLHNPVYNSDTVITGSGFIRSGDTFVAGTMTGWTSRNATGDVAFELSGVNWNIQTFLNAVNTADAGNEGPLLALLSAQPFEYDASDVSGWVELDASGISVPATLTGTNYDDVITGGNGNDLLNPLSAHLGSWADVIVASPGNDQIVLSDFQDSSNGVAFYYSSLTPGTGISATINGSTNSAQIAKGAAGTDTITDIARALDNVDGGFELTGTAYNDSFSLTLAERQWANIFGGSGNDNYTLNINGNSNARLTFRDFGDVTNDARVPATSGVDIDVAAGRIDNNGFGGSGVLTVGGSYLTGEGRLEIYGTANDDSIRGGIGRDRFILDAGFDTVDGGAGRDLLRFDRNQVTSVVTVDLAAGTATGTWDDRDFSYTIRNIEDIRLGDLGGYAYGNEANNRLRGGSDGDHFDGRGGDDTMRGGLGENLYRGGTGHDTVEFDTPASSLTSVIYEAGWQRLQLEVDGRTEIAFTDVELFAFSDRTLSTLEVAQIAGGTVLTGNGTDGDDLILGSTGNNWINPGSGHDLIDGGTGTDMISYVNQTQGMLIDLNTGLAIAEDKNDRLVNIENVTGSVHGDTITGDDGDNRIRGLGDYDWLVGSEGADR
ncbi:MAG: hypothetical protein ACK5M4_03355, partial [Pseudorhodobacter sp.]